MLGVKEDAQSPKNKRFGAKYTRAIEFGDVMNVTLAVLFQGLEYQLKQAHKLADMYRDQVIQLEEQLSSIREQGEVGQQMFKVKFCVILAKNSCVCHFHTSDAVNPASCCQSVFCSIQWRFTVKSKRCLVSEIGTKVKLRENLLRSGKKVTFIA